MLDFKKYVFGKQKSIRYILFLFLFVGDNFNVAICKLCYHSFFFKFKRFFKCKYLFYYYKSLNVLPLISLR